eukprot:1101586-Pleurochrysis_carterae.AAC.1
MERGFNASNIEAASKMRVQSERETAVETDASMGECGDLESIGKGRGHCVGGCGATWQRRGVELAFVRDEANLLRPRIVAV